MDCGGSCRSRLSPPWLLLLPNSTSLNPPPTHTSLNPPLFTVGRQRMPFQIGLRTPRRRNAIVVAAVLRGRSKGQSSAWDDKPFEVLPGGRVSYYDEQDVITFLDPPKELIPLDPDSYNPAAYLWKKIGDVPVERRHRLLYLLKPRLIPRVWQLAGTRYLDDNLAKKSASNLLSMGVNSMPLEFWYCRTSSGPMPMSWLSNFRKVIFRAKDGVTYGRIFLGGSVLAGLANSFCPLYFTMKELNEVMSTEQPCDLAYEFGDGMLDLPDYPEGFPKPVKHPWPFNDHLVVYIRHVGPGVLVGQAWQEGKELEQVPKKFCGEILMVKDYTTSREDK